MFDKTETWRSVRTERRIHKGAEKEDEEQFVNTYTLIMSQHNGSRDENINLLTHSVNGTVFNLPLLPNTVCKPAKIQIDMYSNT